MIYSYQEPGGALLYVDEETGVRIGFKGAAIPSPSELRRMARDAWIKHVLSCCGGSLGLAARVTGIDRSNLRRLARAAGIPAGKVG